MGFSDDLLEKAKYIKREGSPGNYTYIYPGDEGGSKKLNKEDKEKIEAMANKRDEENKNKKDNKTQHNGKNFKKQSNGKWKEVSEHGLTKDEHTEKVNELASKKGEEIGYNFHSKQSAKLSDKEYSNEEVGKK